MPTTVRNLKGHWAPKADYGGPEPLVINLSYFGALLSLFVNRLLIKANIIRHLVWSSGTSIHLAMSVHLSIVCLWTLAKTAAKQSNMIRFDFPRCQMKCLIEPDSMECINLGSPSHLVVKISINKLFDNDFLTQLKIVWRAFKLINFTK